MPNEPILEALNPSYIAKLVSQEQVADDTLELKFKVDEPYSFQPGQYTWLQLPKLDHPDPKGNRRAMSFADIPNSQNTVSFIMRISDSGFKRTIAKIKVGDKVSISKAFGSTFTPTADDSGSLILIAGGTGISPFLSIIKDAVKGDSKLAVSIILADNRQNPLAYSKYINDLPDRNGTQSGKVTYDKLAWEDIKCLGVNPKSIFYVSGPQPFVNLVAELLKCADVKSHQIHYENYYPTSHEVDVIHELVRNEPSVSTQNNSAKVTLAKSVFGLAVESSSHHIIITDINGVVVFANSAAEKITGYSIDEMLGNTPRLWGGLMDRKFYAKLWDSKLKGHSIDSEIVNRRKDGSVYHVMAHIAPFKDTKGAIIGFIGTEENITAIKEAERLALESSLRFKELTEKIPEVYWLVDLRPVEKVTYVSPAYTDLFGVKTTTELQKEPRAWISHIIEEDREKVRKGFDDLVSKGTSFHYKFRVKSPESNVVRWVDARCERIAGQKNNLWPRLVGVARDVTKEQAIDREKTEFVSLASHQLKTPLGEISWNTEMLLNDEYGKLGPKQHDVVEAMHRINVRMRELVNSLLDISRIEMGTLIIKPEPIDFAKLCDEVLTDMQSQIKQHRHKITRSYPDNLSKINADPTLLRSIFQNYISNAVKYTKPGGDIKISIVKGEEDVVIHVANSGEPIPKREQAKIFEKSYRTESAKAQDPEGNGLGLYLVKFIADNGGGKAWFESGEGKDTIFSVSFPLSGMTAWSGSAAANS